MMFSDMKRCRNCAYKGQFPNGTWGCARTNEPINPDADFCSKATVDGCHCDRCNRFILKGQPSYILSRDDEGYMIFCESCYFQLG